MDKSVLDLSSARLTLSTMAVPNSVLDDNVGRDMSTTATIRTLSMSIPAMLDSMACYPSDQCLVRYPIGRREMDSG